MATSDRQTIYNGPSELSTATYVSEAWTDILEKLQKLGVATVRMADGTELSIPEAVQKSMDAIGSVTTDSIKISSTVIKQQYTNLEYEVGAASAILVKDARGSVSVNLTTLQENLQSGAEIKKSFFSVLDQENKILAKREVLGGVIDLTGKLEEAFSMRFFAEIVRDDELVSLSFAVPFDYVKNSSRETVPLIIESRSNNPKNTETMTEILNQVLLRITKLESLVKT